MLNEKEKQAIDMLNKFITEHKLFNIKHSDGLEKNINVVLNLITKLQKESNRLKTYIKENEIYKKRLFEYAEKKDKQINLMAKHIAKEDKTEKFCDYKTVCDNDCEECVEAYFKDNKE